MDPQSDAVIRHYRDDDLGRMVDLWHREGALPGGPGELGVDTATDLLEHSDAEVLVADLDGTLLAAAAGTVSGALGSIFWVVGGERLCMRLIESLESELVQRGARSIAATVGAGGELYRRLVDYGYERSEGVAVMQRTIPATAAGADAVTEIGGRMIEAGLWDQLAGMEQAKQVIERRIILPLAENELASRHGVAPPKAVVLFGPPGTGKTTFAKGVASRLDWPFVPVGVSQLTDGEGDAAARLAAFFDELLELPSAVAFADEVEDLAARRQDERKVGGEVINEFLRQVPRLRDRPHHLLVCATNRVGSLDPAFLRPGRFDYILPVGPPDHEARAAIWSRYVAGITDQEVEIDALVKASELFTPADMEFAARKAAQYAFEEEFFEETTGRATTEHFLTAIEDTRPTLSDEMVADFEQDMERFARY